MLHSLSQSLLYLVQKGNAPIRMAYSRYLYLAQNLYRHRRRTFYKLMGSHICVETTPISASWIPSLPLPFLVHWLVFKSALQVRSAVETIHLHMHNRKSSWNQFKPNYGRDRSNKLPSRTSHKIFSVPQSALFRNKRTAFNQDGESYSISLLQKGSLSIMAFPKNTANSSARLSTMQFNW